MKQRKRVAVLRSVYIPSHPIRNSSAQTPSEERCGSRLFYTKICNWGVVYDTIHQRTVALKDVDHIDRYSNDLVARERRRPTLHRAYPRCGDCKRNGKHRKQLRRENGPLLGDARQTHTTSEMWPCANRNPTKANGRWGGQGVAVLPACRIGFSKATVWTPSICPTV